MASLLMQEYLIYVYNVMEVVFFVLIHQSIALDALLDFISLYQIIVAFNCALIIIIMILLSHLTIFIALDVLLDVSFVLGQGLKPVKNVKM